MTDRLKGCVVVFDEDIREDDAEPLMAAIAQLRGVLSIQPSIRTADDWMIRERVRRELTEKLCEVLRP
ncbi:MAG TPA: hypothetical protein VMY37_11505 [Thermoguttaceae bacterium]|nr:hypothetical protein [Thermoguttaceae bacterium]